MRNIRKTVNRVCGGICVAVLAALCGFVVVDDWRLLHIRAGDCLTGAAQEEPDPVGCAEPAAREVVLRVFEGELDASMCDAVPGAERSYVVEAHVSPDWNVVCTAPRDGAGRAGHGRQV
ncbi:hypothetical protein ABZ924_34975 [Streptomyces sp. NPDC046876]|uniref:LppU/SCO3897 family protein n=1 Tax=Streptomyces sp. NPDC046876 TaxID=3155616 RepID=UPI0033E2B7EF